MTSRRKLETFFGPKGPLAEQWPGFTARPQQVSVAEAIENALKESRPCLAEAGTGVGKTLAYLIPLFRWLDKHEGARAVISTHTIALQAQLVERDIPNLLYVLPEFNIRPAVLKGRANFLCHQDLEAAAGEIWTAGDPQFLQIQRWSRETDTGDVAELDFSYPGWFDIAANQDTCRNKECRHYDRCFYYKARKNAEESNLIIVNHSLFFADLRLKRLMPQMTHLLPEYNAVIFDEAHHVEDTASRSFGLEWGSRRVPALIARVKRMAGVDPMRLAAIEALNLQLMDPFAGASKSEAFLNEALANDQEEAFYELRNDLCSQVNGLARELVKISEGVESPVERDKAAGLARVASRISTELKQVTKPDELPGDTDEDGKKDDVRYFRWYQTRRTRTGQANSTLVRTPLEIGSLLRESLVKATPRVVFISATLTTGNDFHFLKQRIGLDTEETPPTIEVREGSPFDYQKNCLLYVPRYVGEPGGDESLEDAVTEEMARLIQAARGRTFALFTSHRMLRAVWERLPDKCDYPIFTQGDMPNGRLVEAFVSSGEGVLLGSASFWEGVDVPGPALSCVILDKLPFATPDTPTQRAREQAIKEAGGDSFRELSLPQAQMRLKQGFGRLLRTSADRGVVAILDPRLWTKSYGRELMADLPACPRTYDMRDVRAFFAREPQAVASDTVRPVGAVALSREEKAP